MPFGVRLERWLDCRHRFRLAFRSIVTPAKAGVQNPWIPAYAGMTNHGFFKAWMPGTGPGMTADPGCGTPSSIRYCTGNVRTVYWAA